MCSTIIFFDIQKMSYPIIKISVYFDLCFTQPPSQISYILHFKHLSPFLLNATFFSTLVFEVNISKILSLYKFPNLYSSNPIRHSQKYKLPSGAIERLLPHSP